MNHAPLTAYQRLRCNFRSMAWELVFKISIAIVVAGFACNQLAFAQSQAPLPTGPTVTSATAENPAVALKAQMDAAVARVQQIVNQPVPRYKMQRGLRYFIYDEGWFHPGATKPNFNTVDIRTSQEKPYDAQPYVTSPLNPGILFRGTDLEFNANTKYFITDRTVPKKKLTEAEMVEINGLYRIIGRCEDEQNRLLHPTPAPQAAGTTPETGTAGAPTANTSSQGIDPKTAYTLVTVLAVILGLLFFWRKAR